MNPLLPEFKNQFLGQVLDRLWGQWTTLGVAGHAGEPTPWIIDPEALLLATCTFGRCEPRMFDEVLDWLQTNGWAPCCARRPGPERRCWERWRVS